MSALAKLSLRNRALVALVTIVIALFGLVAVLWIGFLVLEGFDFGVGMLIPYLGRNDKERRVLVNTIGPLWDGNEVWLLTAGGVGMAQVQPSTDAAVQELRRQERQRLLRAADKSIGDIFAVRGHDRHLAAEHLRALATGNFSGGSRCGQPTGDLGA